MKLDCPFKTGDEVHYQYGSTKYFGIVLELIPSTQTGKIAAVLVASPNPISNQKYDVINVVTINIEHLVPRG